MYKISNFITFQSFLFKISVFHDFTQNFGFNQVYAYFRTLINLTDD